MKSNLDEWNLSLNFTSIYATTLIITASFAYLGIYLSRSLLAPGAAGTALTGIGGIKLNGLEVVVGSVFSVALLVCVVLYGKLIEESTQIEAAKLLGAWQIEREADFQTNENAIVDWLVQGEREFDDEALLESRTQWAVSLADQHKITKRGFRIAGEVIHAVFWFIVTVATLQILLISQYLHGLRVLMPAMLVGLMILAAFLASGAPGLVSNFGASLVEIPLPRRLP